MGHRLMGEKTLALLAGGFLLLTTASAADAAMILRLEEVDGDVVVRGSGSINLIGLISEGASNTATNSFNAIHVYAGPAAEDDDGHVEFWSGLTGGPATISSTIDFFVPLSSASFGDLFGIISNDGSGVAGAGKALLVLPQGYISGTQLSGTSRFTGQTFTTMGISLGTLTWTSGSNTVQFTTDAEPVPAPLGVASAAAVFSTIRRLKHNTRILQLASRKRAAVSATNIQ